MRRAGVLLLAGLTCAAASCGSRVATGPAAAAPSTVAPTTALTAPSTSTTTKVEPVVTTAAGAISTTTKAQLTPTTKAPPAKPTTTAADPKVELCKAAQNYALSDLIGLGDHILADPDGLLASYESLLAHAPADLLKDITLMGPLTRTAVAATKKGEIKTAPELQQWLVNAPRENLENWVKSQQIVAPALKVRCA